MRVPLPRFAFKLVVLLIGIPSVPLPGAFSQSGPQQTFTISGKISGVSGGHTLHVALWNESGFLTRPVEEVQIKPGAEATFAFHVSPGQWAVSAYEDRNENGRLDMGMLGPKEPNGFYRPFHQWHKPRFAEVSFNVTHDTPGADIALRR